MKRIAISTGHSTLDPGAIGIDGTKEYDLNKRIVEYLLNDFPLRDNREWWQCDIDCEHLPYPDHLNKTINNINNAAEDNEIPCCVEIHHNSCANPDRRGGEVIYYDHSPNGRQLALAISFHLLFMSVTFGPFKDMWRRFDRRDYDVKDRATLRHVKRRLAYLANTDVPAVIVEPGFLSNAKDLAMVKKYAKPIAKAIRIGVDTWLDVFDC